MMAELEPDGIVLSSSSMVDSRQIPQYDPKHLRKKQVSPKVCKAKELGKVRYVCNGCGKTTESYSPPDSFSRCSCCKAVYYCNKSCQMMDFMVDGVATRNMSHRECCEVFVKDLEEFNQDPNGLIVQTRVFPWAKHHHTTGAFFLKEFLARRGIVRKMGFWASAPHLMADDSNGWCHGMMLLHDKLPSIKQGWLALKESEIPSGPAPCRPIHSWAEYAKLRNMARSSIAPLLLTNILTIYQMLIHEFDFRRRKPKNGKFFVIYALGVESELNYLPLLEELCYLLPKRTDVELRLVSPAVKHLVYKALRGYPKSYLASCGGYVFDKTAPNGGRVRVSLKGLHALFHEVKLSSVPDAVIGLNARIADCVEWPDTVMRLLALEIPFSFSEPTQHAVRSVKDKLIPIWIKKYNADSPGKRPSVTAPQRMEIRLNPFHGIVGRDQATLLTPNISNGYLLTWNQHCLNCSQNQDEANV